MSFRIVTAGLLSMAILAGAGNAMAQTAAPEWRTVAPENLLVIDTVKGRILVELEPRVAPRSVERIRTLADQGFYDGLKFHRVLEGFMARPAIPKGPARAVALFRMWQASSSSVAGAIAASSVWSPVPPASSAWPARCRSSPNPTPR